MAALDLTGQIFTRLTVLRFIGLSRMPSGTKRVWECRCLCGAKVEATTGDLRSGRMKSCNCMTRDRIIAANAADAFTKHGHARHKTSSKSREYVTWRAMNARCRNPHDPAWKYYGGRGIQVCERWHAFENFLADMGPRPEGKSLDRWPNNSGNYEPGNCRWATPKEQAQNKPRRSHDYPI